MDAKQDAVVFNEPVIKNKIALTGREFNVNWFVLAAGSTALSIASALIFRGRTFRNIFGVAATALAIAGAYEKFDMAKNSVDPRHLH